jgi:hypothetical protein
MAGGNALPAIIFAQYEKSCLHIKRALLVIRYCNEGPRPANMEKVNDSKCLV